MPTSLDDAKLAAESFRVPGALLTCEPYGAGRIHDSFVARFGAASSQASSAPQSSTLLVQRINAAVFRDVPGLMANIALVTVHLRGKVAARSPADLGRRALMLVPTRDGEPYLRRGDTCFRAYHFVEGSRSAAVGDLRALVDAARMLGRFHQDLADMPAAKLTCPLPGFHDTVQRLRALEQAAVLDAVGRAQEVRADLERIRSHASLAVDFADAFTRGDILLRVAHNDPKLDNVLFDAATGEALCMVDLDTIMPGSWLHDFGDFVRSASCAGLEDASELGADAALDLPTLERLTHAYLESTRDTLTSGEWAWLSRAPSLLALELAARFLEDHLRGDTYFRVTRAGDNLRRARLQLAVLDALERAAPLFASWLAEERARG